MRPEVRAIILYGEGQAFSAGIDFTSLANDTGAKGGAGGGPDMQRFRRFVHESQASLNRLESIEKPVIGALHGSSEASDWNSRLHATRESQRWARDSECRKSGSGWCRTLAERHASRARWICAVRGLVVENFMTARDDHGRGCGTESRIA